ncbi:Ubiquitin thioesterase trabid [Papilio xuthus]|uniref:ubiquitinyl hydrolase 1 n=1 Tax=Papilio xuthus TaxID=66420 RepID=A0A0N1I513_PAPXU|nr:Ubiquitin thioesterase trabid [Papilio xuthus]
MSEEAHNDSSKNTASVAESQESGGQGAESIPAQLDASTNVSHAQLGQSGEEKDLELVECIQYGMLNNCLANWLHLQMTASSVPHLEGKWMCEMCTYENFPLSRKCTMCRTPKPSLGEDIFKLQQDGASALPSQQVCGAEAVAERLKPLRISSPQGQASASSVNKWACSTCTYENWPRALKCAMCGAASAPHHAHHPHHTNQQNDGGTEVCNNSQSGAHETDAARRSKRRNNPDWLWLQACLGAYCTLHAARCKLQAAGDTSVVEGEARCVEAYLASGGSPARALTPPEVQLLNRASAFDAGHTLVHLAIRSCVPGSRLYALWNRSAGDCLPDALCQAAYGVFDRGNALRQALADSLHHAHRRYAGGRPRYTASYTNHHLYVLRRIVCSFYERWQAWERWQASLLQYAPEESQLRAEWARLTAAAARPGTPLHQVHVFAFAHVMRRPIIVYGVDVVNSFRGEALGYAKFQGIYLPLLWEPEFCCKSPLCLGYTRGHFSALVPLEPYPHRHSYICREQQKESEEVTFLPLTDSEGKLLPVHFLTGDEVRAVSCEGGEAGGEAAVRRYVSAAALGGGARAARQRLHPRPLLQAQMLEEWLNHYRRLAQQSRGPFPPRLHAAADFSSDPDSDDE